MARHPSSVRPSVCLSVCKLLRKSLLLAAPNFHKMDSRSAYIQGVLKVKVQGSRDTGTFVLAEKSLLLPGKWPDRDQTCTRWTTGQRASRMCSRSRWRSKVTWYAHFVGFLEWATPSLTVWFYVVLYSALFMLPLLINLCVWISLNSRDKAKSVIPSLHTGRHKTQHPFYFGNNFGKCWLILIILSLPHSQ